MIDWARIAVPQPDGYDTVQLLDLARERWGYVRQIGDGPRWLGLELLKATAPNGETLLPVELEDPRLEGVAGAIDAWPDGRRALAFLDHFTPLQYAGELGAGSCSGHNRADESGGRMGVYVTINDAIGGAEGVMHELAHQRLHAMGIDLEAHDRRLLLNDDEWRFFSPIRRDVLRPMSALLHGIYAWTFVLEIDLANDGLTYLASNVPKVRRGLQEIEANVQATDEGQAFLGGFLSWAHDATARGERALLEAGVAERHWDDDDGTTVPTPARVAARARGTP